MEQLGLTKLQKEAAKDSQPNTAFIIDENYMASAVGGVNAQEEAKDQRPLQRYHSEQMQTQVLQVLDQQN